MNIKTAVPIALTGLTLCLAACSAEAPKESSSTGSSTPGQQSPTATSGWAFVPANGAAGIKAAGLDILSAEGSAEHIHAHLDVISDGHAVPVPADIGFSFGSNGQPNGISALHTHDPSGIIHIEAPTAGVTYTLGQVLTEWGVLDGKDSTPGSAHSSTGDWQVYVNGTQQPGDPKDTPLRSHDEILLVHGPAPATIPSSYSFPSGY